MIEQGGRGGVADYTAELVAALAAEGWTVTLATAADHRYRPIDGVTVRPVFHYMRGATRLARALRARGLGRAGQRPALPRGAPAPDAAGRAARTSCTPRAGRSPQIGLARRRLPAPHRQPRSCRPSTARSIGRAPSVRTRRLTRRLSARLTARTIVHTQADLDPHRAAARRARVGDPARRVRRPRAQRRRRRARAARASRSASRRTCRRR